MVQPNESGVSNRGRQVGKKLWPGRWGNRLWTLWLDTTEGGGLSGGATAVQLAKQLGLDGSRDTHSRITPAPGIWRGSLASVSTDADVRRRVPKTTTWG